MYNENKKNEKRFSNGGCPSCVYEYMDVAVPVDVRAYADIGNVTFKCIGSTILPNPVETYSGPGTNYKFTICQRIQLDIPIVCSAEANIGQEQVYYDKPHLNFDTSKESNTYNCSYNCNRNLLTTDI